MCLAVVGRLESVTGEGAERTGVVDLGTVRRTVGLAFTPDASPGAWVMIHSGYAVSVVTDEDARATIDLSHEVGA